MPKNINEEKVKKVVIGDNISDLVSGCQKYQLFQCLLIFIPVIFVSMSNTNFVFSAAATEYRCLVPQCETINSSFPPKWWPSSVEDYKCSRPIFKHNKTCDPDAVLGTDTCHDWVYKDNNSVVTEFGLACQELKVTMIGTIHNLGVLVGMPIIGLINDRWGRKTGVILNSVCLCIGALKTLTSNYNQYVVIEFFEAALVTGAYTSCYILLVELIGTDKRIIASALLGLAICSGEIILAFIVYNFPYWRHFQLIIAFPGLIFLTYVIFLEESMRWLLTNGKTKKAVRLLEKIGNWNQFSIPEKAMDEKSLAAEKDGGSKEEFHVKLLFRYPAIFKRLIVCACWWFSVSLVYYGLIFSSVYLPGNKYTNYALSGFISIFGEFIPLPLLNRIGRKKTFIGSCFIAGVCNVALAYIPPVYNIPQLIVFLVGKMSMTCCFNTLYVYTSELMPTSARGFLMGTCSMVARIGTVLAPLVLLLGQKYKALPSLLFGCASLLTAALAFTTPETLNRQLPDTIAEAISLA
ncbi:organic cation transporter protein-like [Aricia agestis]|uniref:organic cation transporter protein-like n=1 Tax=Aricia agestis TaxID=91739 RepID=UPI001C205C5C|nr:organic cation transporter protein-like [Aricia agestis]